MCGGVTFAVCSECGVELWLKETELVCPGCWRSFEKFECCLCGEVFVSKDDLVYLEGEEFESWECREVCRTCLEEVVYGDLEEGG